MKLVWLLVFICAAVNVDCVNGKFTKSQRAELEQFVSNVVESSSCCTRNQKTPVAFHAEIKTDRSYIGDSTWVFDNVVTNEGDAYNSTTGEFTTPSTGIYLFNWYTVTRPTISSHAGLYVNGEIKGRQVSHSTERGDTWVTAGSSIVLKLVEGDSVCIRDAHKGASYVTGLWTAFGGVQLG